jgi:hypothetical protein
MYFAAISTHFIWLYNAQIYVNFLPNGKKITH